MNERIRELYTQASSLARALVPDLREIPIYERIKSEKFAELIVGECIATIANDTANYPGVGTMAYYQGVQDSAKAIKQHFGVE